jgi:hypothetical protein
MTGRKFGESAASCRGEPRAQRDTRRQNASEVAKGLAIEMAARNASELAHPTGFEPVTSAFGAGLVTFPGTTFSFRFFPTALI